MKYWGKFQTRFMDSLAISREVLPVVPLSALSMMVLTVREFQSVIQVAFS